MTSANVQDTCCLCHLGASAYLQRYTYTHTENLKPGLNIKYNILIVVYRIALTEQCRCIHRHTRAWPNKGRIS